MKPLQANICLFAVLALAQPLYAGDAARGEDKAKEVCAACHGADGISQNPIYPHIGGQYEDYLLHSLRGYKSGERQNVIMKGQVATLTDEELENLAAYYASQTGVLHKVPKR